MNSQANLSLLRQVLTFLGALLAGRGIVSASQASTLVNDITVAIPALVSIGSIAWSVYAHWNQVKVPEQTPVIPPASSGTVVGAGLAVKEGLLKAVMVFAALALAMPAFAATPTPTPRPASAPQGFLQQLEAFAEADLNAAIADANAHNMPAAAKCYSTILAMKTSPLIQPVPKGVGVFSGMQLLLDADQDLQNLNSLSGPITDLVSACSPVVVKLNAMILQTAAGAGGLVAFNPVASAGATALKALLASALSIVIPK